MLIQLVDHLKLIIQNFHCLKVIQLVSFKVLYKTSIRIRDLVKIFFVVFLELSKANRAVNFSITN